MFGPDDFLAARKCFVFPIPELEEAADLLSDAADALLTGDYDLARECLRKADMPVIHQYASRIMGRVDKDIHRYRPVEAGAVQANPIVRVEQRKPSLSLEKTIYQRDGCRCRFCGTRVVLGAARTAMRAVVPKAIRWGGTSQTQHSAFFALTATIDHLKPYSRGGNNEPQNLLTTCWPCNFGRGKWLIEEVGLIDPTLQTPVLDEWDGLAGMVGHRSATTPRQDRNARAVIPTSFERTADPHSRNEGAFLSRQAWFDSLDRVEENASSRLLAFLTDCRDVHVDWGLNKVLVVRVRSKDIPLQVFGILPDGFVEAPWFIGSYKQEFRAFALALALAVPGSVAYETPKTWSVRKLGRRHSRERGERITIGELLNASTAIKSALGKLCAAVNH